MDCWKCPQAGQKRPEVKLKTKKCWLYPEWNKPVVKPKPPQPHCPTLYTKCDYARESYLHAQTLKIEEEFHQYEGLHHSEMEKQYRLIEQLWQISQRYLFLANSGVCVKPYPEIVSVPAEKRICCTFAIKLKELNYSNTLLMVSIGNIRESWDELKRLSAQLDLTVESPFLVGNAYHRPFAYTSVLINNLFTFFYTNFCKLRTWSELIDIGDSGSIEDYITLIKPLPKFRRVGLHVGVEGCTCMRSRHFECLLRHKPCDS